MTATAMILLLGSDAAGLTTCSGVIGDGGSTVW